MSNQQFGLIDNWIRHIKDVYRFHQDELEGIQDMGERENRFIELNVIEQVYDLAKTSIIQNSWSKSKSPFIHGWVYDIRNGLINDLKVSVNENSDLPKVYQFENIEALK